MEQRRQSGWMGLLFLVITVSSGGSQLALVGQALAATTLTLEVTGASRPDGTFTMNDELVVTARITVERTQQVRLKLTITPELGPAPELHWRLISPVQGSIAFKVYQHTFTGREVQGSYAIKGSLSNWMEPISESVAVVFARNQRPDDQTPQPCTCTGQPGDTVELTTRVTAAQSPVPDWPVTFTRLLGDGDFVEAMSAAATSTDANASVTTTVLTDADGRATAHFMLGHEPLQLVAAQAGGLPNDPVIFRITLGPLAGNGIGPGNIAAGGDFVYTANGGTRNVSVLDATGRSREVVAVADFTLLRTPFDVGTVMGVTVNAEANRLYVYGVTVCSGVGVAVLIVVDTMTNRRVGPDDPDSDGCPGFTLVGLPPSSSPDLTSLPPGQILREGFANLVTVDAGRRRIYAVVPGMIEGIVVGNHFNPVNIANGELIVLDGSSDALAIVRRVPVGEVPTGVAVNSTTNKIYVTNRGYITLDNLNDTMTVVDGEALSVVARIAVGRGPFGVKVDDVNDVIYVSNSFGEESLGICDQGGPCGAVSVIDGSSTRMIQTIPTSGTTDLAVLVGAETDILADEIDRIYVEEGDRGGTVFDCDLTASPPCQRFAGGIRGKLAINASKTLLFGTHNFNNRVAVFDLTNNTPVGEIPTGVTVGGLAVDPQTGIAYVSDNLQVNAELFVIDPSGAVSTIDLSRAMTGPGQVEVDEINRRIYIVSPNGAPPLIALNLASGALAARLEPAEWVYGFPGTLGVDKGRNLLYISSTSASRVVVFDGAQFSGNTSVSRVRLGEVVVGREDGTERAIGVAVDEERNLIYVTRFSFTDKGRDALVVLRGADLDIGTRTLWSPPEVVAEVPIVGVQFRQLRGPRRDIAIDPGRNLIYVGGVVAGQPRITVLDGLKIVDAQGQVTPNPAEALLGDIPIRALPVSGIPIDRLLDYGVAEIAFTAAEDLLYVVIHASATFTEGFLAVINSLLVIDGDRNFIRTPHPEEPETLISVIATIPAGVDPEFVAVDARLNRVLVTNQSLGVLSVLRGLSME